MNIVKELTSDFWRAEELQGHRHSESFRSQSNYAEFVFTEEYSRYGVKKFI